MPCAAASHSMPRMCATLAIIGCSRRAAKVAIETWSSWLAEVGAESTEAGCDICLFSLISAAAVHCGQEAVAVDPDAKTVTLADGGTISGDVLVIAAGVNDLTFTDEQIQAEAAALFDEISAALPDTLVFVTGPMATLNRVRGGVNTAIKAAVGTRTNFVWVPNVDEPWLTGTGTVASTRGDGNADQYISADITHPTPAGIDYLAGKLAEFVKQAVN